jgi:peptidyl-prolyl cis-trans isomerase B (cyclophilin B)
MGAQGPGAQGPGAPATGTRAANRAAKRATLGVRPKTVRRGHVVSRPSRRFNPAVLFLAIAALAVGAGVILLGNPFGTPAASPTAAVYGDGTCPTAQPAPLPAGQSRLATIETSLGKIVVRVDGALSPIAAGNFVALAECGYYDGVIFHRTASLENGTPFVIQAGDPDGTGAGPGPGYTIEDEPVTATYRRGTVAMARTQQPNSQGSQFFIVLDDRSTGPLTQANTYAIFGEVTSGMEVADAILQASGGAERPASPIEIISVTISDAPPASTAPSPASTPSPAASPAGSTAPAASPASTP